MNFSEQIRNISRDDSRRYAKGIYCNIIHRQKTLDILRRQGVIPPGINLIAPENNPFFDSRLGKFFVIPAPLYKDYLYAENSIPTLNTIPLKLTIEEKLQVIKEKEKNFAEFMVGNLVLVSIPVERINKIPDPENNDVIIETLDLNQTMDCIFVKKSGKFRDEKKTIRDK